MVTDDQTLMMAMPASREFVMADDGKMYKGFTLPPNMSADQEQRYKDAIDEREAGAMQRRTERGRSDRLETAEDIAEIVAASPVGQIPAAGADAFVMGRDIQRGDYGMAAISGASILIPYVSAKALKSIAKGGTDAAESALRRLKDLESRLEAGTINEAEAKRIGSSIEQEFSRVDPEDLAMERRQDVREGITMDMRGTPRVDPPSRDFTPDQMADLEAEARRRGLSGVDELLDLMDEGGSFRDDFLTKSSGRIPGGGAARSSGPKSFFTISEEEDLYDIMGTDTDVLSLDPAFVTPDQRTRLLQRFDDLKEADKQLFSLRRQQGFLNRSQDSYEENLRAQLREERDQIRELLFLGNKRTRAGFLKQEALRKNLLDRKIERARLRTRKRGLKEPTDEEYARMANNFFSPITQRRPTAGQIAELEADSRRLGLSSVDELLDLQDEFFNDLPYTYRERRSLTGEQLSEIESQARRLGLSTSEEYLEFLEDTIRD